MPVSEAEHNTRLTRVEDEVGGIKNEVVGLKAQLRGFGDVLVRIEDGVKNYQQQWQDDKQAARINPIALTTILISIISILVGGAWLVSGNLARLDERSATQQRWVERLDQRQWEKRETPRAAAPAEQPHP